VLIRKIIAVYFLHKGKELARRKGTPFQSAMSVLNFYINRGGKNLSESKKKMLERSREELRKVFQREGPAEK